MNSCTVNPAAASSNPTASSKKFSLSLNMKNNVVLNRYKILKTIGKGTFGKVYLCKDLVNQCEVALKIIDHANIRTNRERKNVSREIRLVKILYHPHIIEIFDMKEMKDTTVIAMEFAANGELHDYVTKKGLPEDKARDLFRQIVSAVDYCHQSSIVHRDLKPENLLIDAYHNVKLIDFGFGNTYSDGSNLTTYCGSPFYAAPEMTQGIPYTGPEVDIWSLGVILYFMLVGELPFNGSNINELYDAIASGLYEKSPKIKESADDLLSKMLCVNPRQRIVMADLKKHPWVNAGNLPSIDTYIGLRPSSLKVLDDQVLEEVKDLGYDRRDYYEAFSRPAEKSPVKSLYHLHKEWLERKAIKGSLAANTRPQLTLKIGTPGSSIPSPAESMPPTSTTLAESPLYMLTTPLDAFNNMSQEIADKAPGTTSSTPTTPTQKSSSFKSKVKDWFSWNHSNNNADQKNKKAKTVGPTPSPSREAISH